MTDSSLEKTSNRLRRIVLKGCVHAVSLLFLLALAGSAAAETVNAWASVNGATTASGTGKEIVLPSYGYISVDCKLTGFDGKIRVWQGNISGRLHFVFTINSAGAAVTCPTAAGVSDPCQINLNPGYQIVRIDFDTASAGTMNSCDVTGSK